MIFQKDADRTRGDDFGDSSDHGSEISGSLGRDTKVDRSLSAAWHPLSGADHPRTYRVLRTTEGNGWREFAAKRAGVSINLDRGDTSMTSALRGGRGVTQNVKIALIRCMIGIVTRERGKKSKISRSSIKHRPQNGMMI